MPNRTGDGYGVGSAAIHASGRRSISATTLGTVLIVLGGFAATATTLLATDWSFRALAFVAAWSNSHVSENYLNALQLLRLLFSGIMLVAYVSVEGAYCFRSHPFWLPPGGSRLSLYWGLLVHHAIMLRDCAGVVLGAGAVMVGVYWSSSLLASLCPEEGIGGFSKSGIKTFEEVLAILGYFAGLGIQLQAFFEKHYAPPDAPRQTGGLR